MICQSISHSSTTIPSLKALIWTLGYMKKKKKEKHCSRNIWGDHERALGKTCWHCNLNHPDSGHKNEVKNNDALGFKLSTNKRAKFRTFFASHRILHHLHHSRTSHAIDYASQFSLTPRQHIQGDHSGCDKPPVDIKINVAC